MEEDSQEVAKPADEREKEEPNENGTNGEVNEPKPKETPKSKAKRNVKARTGIVMLVFFFAVIIRTFLRIIFLPGGGNSFHLSDFQSVHALATIFKFCAKKKEKKMVKIDDTTSTTETPPPSKRPRRSATLPKPKADEKSKESEEPKAKKTKGTWGFLLF